MLKQQRNFSTANLDESVEIFKHPLDNEKIQTIPEFLRKIASSHGENFVFTYKDPKSDFLVSKTYQQFYDQVVTLAKYFLSLGLTQHGVVAIFAFNCFEWFLAEIAAIFGGGIICGIDPTSTCEALLNILEAIKAEILIIDCDDALDKFKSIKSRLSRVPKILSISKNFITEEVSQIFEISSESVENFTSTLEERSKTIKPNECCLICFSSGTTGNPKGAMISHDNLLFSANQIIKQGPKNSFEFTIAYLPFFHIAAQHLQFFVPLSVAGKIYIAAPDAVRGSILDILSEIRPTFFFGVPRIFEKMIEKEKFNLQKAKLIFMGGAKCNRKVLELLKSKNIFISSNYGSTECGSITISQKGDTDTVGKFLEHSEVKIVNENLEGVGEICIRGRNVFLGYLNDTGKTLDAIDDERFFHTGDLGMFDSDGNLIVTGRIKELIKTSNGKNIPFLHIEELVKSECSLISNAILIGDNRKFLSILIALIKSIENETQIIQSVIDEVNKKVATNDQKIRKFKILRNDFSVEGGELTSTLKLRRNFIHQKYEKIINEFYE